MGSTICGQESPNDSVTGVKSGVDPSEEIVAGIGDRSLNAQAEELRQKEEADRKAAELQAAEEERLKNAEAAQAAAAEKERLAKEEEERTIEKNKKDTEDKKQRQLEFEALLSKTRQEMTQDVTLLGEAQKRNRYGPKAKLPEYEPGLHVPILALINPHSGAKAGRDILQVALRSECYKNSFFNIISIISGQQRGGPMDIFRIALLGAVEEAKRMNTRCRLISAGGDGTASFAMFVVFKTLQAHNDREEDGLKDSGNGFIWTDAQFEAQFPALAQMPLGSANDCGNILGWGQVYPGDGCCVCGKGAKAQRLIRWIEGVLDARSLVAEFDVWGIMPPRGKDSTNFKIAELTGNKGISPRIKKDGKYQLNMKTTGNPVPLFVCLYFSVGFFGYVVARFQLNRHATPFKNTLEYIRQGASIILFENPPPQLRRQLDGITIDAGGEPYFPPRREKGNKASNYRECGFFNINWQAHKFHGKDRAPLCTRMCGRGNPVKFNDGLLDLQRQKLLTLAKNPGFTMQTEKRKDFHLKFDGGDGKGFFFQYDGEARFAFTPDGAPFELYIRQVLNLPVVIGPYHNEKLTGTLTAASKFQFHGDTPDEVEQVKRRILRNLDGGLEKELCATNEELVRARLVQTPM